MAEMKGKQRMSHCLDLCSVRSGCSFVFVLCLETVEKKNVLLQLSVWVAYLGCVEFDAPPARQTLHLVYVNRLGCVV